MRSPETLSFIASKKFSCNKIWRLEMKPNRLSNILLLAVIFVLISGRIPVALQTAVQPVAAASGASGVSSMLPNAVSGYITVPAAAFTPYSPAVFYHNGGYMLTLDSHDQAKFHAQVNLPDGATIDELSCLMRDYGTNENAICGLIYVTLSGPSMGLAEEIGSAFTDQSTTDWALYSAASLSNAQVDNSQRAYMITLYLTYDDSTHFIKFAGARIHYYYSAVYLPSVSK